MKKIMTVAAAAASMLALGAGVESGVVGYQSNSATAQRFSMLGVQFQGVDGNADGATLDELVSGDFAAIDYDDDGNWTKTSPMLQIWTPGSGYTVCYYQTDPLGTGDAEAEGWVDALANYIGDTRVKPGTAFWFLNPSATEAETVTFAGSVLDTSSSYTVPTAATGFTMIANPWPKDIAINSTKITWNNITAVDYDDNGNWTKTSPMLQIWDGVKYNVYYYQTDPEGTGDTEAWGWVDALANYADDTVVLSAGHAAWFLAGTGDTGAGSITFSY